MLHHQADYFIKFEKIKFEKDNLIVIVVDVVYSLYIIFSFPQYTTS